MKIRGLKRGFGTVDVLFALAIMGLMIAVWARQQNENYTIRRADSMATSVSSVLDATKYYISNNYDTLLSNINVGDSIEVPLIDNPTFLGIGDLSTASSRLPSGFTGHLARDQVLHLIVKHVAQEPGKPAHLAGMVLTTGGSNMTDREVGLAVNTMGLSGGGIMARPPAGESSSNVYGGYGTWSYATNDWKNGSVTPTVGNIAMITDKFTLPKGG